ncbi:MAG: hypothetical protein ACC661_07170 [Verrucomicrobiales bacterium]
MSAQPNDSLLTRFASFTWGMTAVFSFGVAALIVVGFNALSTRGDATYDDGRGAARTAVREKIDAAQSAAMASLTPALEKAVLARLKASSPAPSKVPVPGTPAALKLMEQQAVDAAAAQPAAEGVEDAEGAATGQGAAKEAK